MHAESATIDDLFGPEQRLRAPLFQRRYVWSEDAHLAPFWIDLRSRATLRLGPGPAAYPHFLGAILLQRDGADPGLKRIIDGQQRLLTLYLTLAAVRTVAAARQLDDLAERAEARLLDARARLKLTPTAPDQDQVAAIVGRGDVRSLAALWRDRFAAGRARLLKSSGQPDCLSAYVGLHDRVKAFAAGDGAHPLTEPEVAAASPAERLEALHEALLQDFRVVQIDLAAGDDGPAIFEALNDRGAPLQAADLVRNDVVRRARVGGEDPARLIAEHWRPLAQDAFWRASTKIGRAKAPQLDNLLRCYLTASGAPPSSPKRVFHAYRAFVSRNPPPFATVDDELATFGRAAAIFRRLAPGASALATGEAPPADQIGRIGRRIAPWAPSAVLAPILAVAMAEDAGETDRRAAYELIVGYLVRRDVCQLNRRNLHRAGAALCRAIVARPAGASLLVAVAETLALHAGLDALWPNDLRFARHWVEDPIWRPGGGARARRLLIELEADASGRSPEEIAAERPQADHVMPRTWGDAFGDPWPAPVSAGPSDLDDAFRRRERAVDGIGNLALIEPRLNARIGNAGFAARRDAYAASRYVTTQALARVGDWDEAAMARRAHSLLPAALRLWPGPDAGVGQGVGLGVGAGPAIVTGAALDAALAAPPP